MPAYHACFCLFSCIGDISWFGIDYNWSMGNSKILYTHYLYTLTPHSVVFKIQCTVFFPITTQTSISVIIISALVITVGVLVIAGVVGCVLYVKYERPSTSVLNKALLMTVIMVSPQRNLSLNCLICYSL